MRADNQEHIQPEATTRHWWWPMVAIWTFVGVMIAAGLLMRLVVPPDRGQPATSLIGRKCVCRL
jgi:hypothetical protein